VKKKIVLLYLFCICIASINCQEFPYEPWGPWDTYPLNKKLAVILVYKSESFYRNGNGGIRIAEDYSTGDDTFPAFVVNGGFTKIERYEQMDYGYLFYLVDDGIRHKTNEKPDFKDDMRMQVKMIFIDRDTCKFEFISLYDEEGYRVNIFLQENTVYHRYRVEDE
jgi:hypothetical protein